jgi:hypothetical protein
VNCQNPVVSGVTVDGGYAEVMIAEARAITSIPDELTSAEAAPLLCAGITTYNALRNVGLRGGDLVAVQGIGGLGHLGVQFARQLGFHTVAIGRGGDKEKLAKDLGAHVYIDTAVDDAVTGSNEWTCLPGPPPGPKHDDPGCFDSVFFQWLKDDLAGRPQYIERLGVSYMFMGQWVPGRSGGEFHVGPHIMVVAPHQEELQGFTRGGWNGTYIIHLPGADQANKWFLVIPVHQADKQ